MSAASVSAWSVVGHSVRGAAHVREDIPNQDAVAHASGADRLPACAIAAIADGHGGKRHFRSADGSRLAVQVAVDRLQALAPRFAAASPAERSQMAATEVPPQIVAAWVDEVRRHLDACPITRDEWQRLEAAEGPDGVASVQADPLLAYGATLLAALATNDVIGLWQLGDGDVVAVSPDGTVSRPVATDERLLGNLTTSICRPGAEADFRSAVLSSPAAQPALVMLSTDGYANSFRTDADFLKVGVDLHRLIGQHGLPAIESRLGGILEDASANGSGDDITVALLHRDGPHASGVSTAANEPIAASPVPPPKGTADASQALAAAQRRIASLRSVVALLLVAMVAAVLWWSQDGKRLPADAPLLAKPTVVEPPASGVKPSSSAPVAGLKPPIAMASPSGGKPLQAASGSDAPTPIPMASAAPEEPHLAYLRQANAVRTAAGIDVTVTVSGGAAPSPSACAVRAIVFGAGQRELGEQRVDVPDFGADNRVDLQMQVPYPKDEKLADKMRQASAAYAVFLDCGGNTVHSLAKRPLAP